MRRVRIILLVLLAGVFLAIALTLRGAGVLGTPVHAQVKGVPEGDQEVAWIHAATSGASWERFVAGVRLVPNLQVDDSRAFLDQTAAVPEVVIGVPGCAARLWVRWYKLTSEFGTGHWVDRLLGRSPPPLAVIGGATSDRALDLARALAETAPRHGPPPLLLITTATADKVAVEGEQFPSPDLLGVHAGRSFRFCFTNRQMAEAVTDFVWSQPELRPRGSAAVPLGAVAAGAAGPWPPLAVLAAEPELDPPLVYAVEWEDDPYSIDLSEEFRTILHQPDKKPNAPLTYWLPYSVGGYDQPNPREAVVVEHILRELARAPVRRPLLVLPTTERPARRVLRALSAAAPLAARNLVAVTGDAIAFNSVYRDRDIAWNVRDIPVPLVFFCHQDPVAWPAADGAGTPATDDATDDVLLNADVVRILVEAAFEPASPPPGGARLLASADELAARLRALPRNFFGPDGNRREGSGEHVVCLRPHFRDGQVLASATLQVWTRQASAEGPGWRLRHRLAVPPATAGPGDSHAAE